MYAPPVVRTDAVPMSAMVGVKNKSVPVLLPEVRSISTISVTELLSRLLGINVDMFSDVAGPKTSHMKSGC